MVIIWEVHAKIFPEILEVLVTGLYREDFLHLEEEIEKTEWVMKMVVGFN